MPGSQVRPAPARRCLRGAAVQSRPSSVRARPGAATASPCSTRTLGSSAGTSQFRELLNLPPRTRSASAHASRAHPAHPAPSAASFGPGAAQTSWWPSAGRALRRTGDDLPASPRRRPRIWRSASAPMPRGRLRHAPIPTSPTRVAGCRSAGPRQRDARGPRAASAPHELMRGQHRARPRQGARPRSGQHLENPLPRRRQPRRAAAPQRGAPRHEPGRAPAARRAGGDARAQSNT